MKVTFFLNAMTRFVVKGRKEGDGLLENWRTRGSEDLAIYPMAFVEMGDVTHAPQAFTPSALPRSDRHDHDHERRMPGTGNQSNFSLCWRAELTPTACENEYEQDEVAV